MLKLLYHCFFIPQTGSTLLLLYAYVHSLELLLHGCSTMAKTRGGSVTASGKSAHLAERGRQQPQIAAGQMPSGSLASQLPSPLPSSTPNPPTSQESLTALPLSFTLSFSPAFSFSTVYGWQPSLSTFSRSSCSCSSLSPFLLPLPPPKPVLPTISVPPTQVSSPAYPFSRPCPSSYSQLKLVSTSTFTLSIASTFLFSPSCFSVSLSSDSQLKLISRLSILLSIASTFLFFFIFYLSLSTPGQLYKLILIT